MRHRRRGRKLGRSPSHQRALLRNLACSLILTERDAELDDNKPKIKGRITSTLAKAKEVRPLVEKCVTIARRSLSAQREADDLGTDADRLSEEWRSWRESDRWHEWNQAVAPVLAARRRVIKLLGNQTKVTSEAVDILFETIAPRFEDRQGGYTRIMRLATPRLGDAGLQAILEFVGVRDRVSEGKSEAPAFEDEDEGTDEVAEQQEEESVADEDEGESGEAESEDDESTDDEDGAEKEA